MNKCGILGNHKTKLKFNTPRKIAQVSFILYTT